MQTASRLLTIDPLQEGVHRSLMRLYHEIGNTAQALRQYVTCEKVLRRELGVEPEDATNELRRVILRSRNVAAPKADDKTEPARDDRFSRPNGTETSSDADVSVTTPSDRPSIAVLPFSNLSGDSRRIISVTGSPRTSLLACPDSRSCSSSLATHPLSTRARP